MLTESDTGVRPIDAYPYHFHIALDGNGINGLEGMAGVCLFLYDPADHAYAYKIRYYDGIAAGHAVSLNPSGAIGFLGNAGQHLLLYDGHTLNELGRVSTLRYETPRTSLQGSTHVTWLSDDEFITAIGEPREVVTQVFDVLARGNMFTNSRHILGALRVSRFTLLDSIYACQLSGDQSLLFTANRGLNHISIDDYPGATLRLRVPMPPIQDYFPCDKRASAASIQTSALKS